MRPLSRNEAVFRLTALWALCESGLGGWMHALGLPFTGFFVGGFAVIIISMIAWFSQNNVRQILQATMLVLAIKAAVSPQSPPPAYIAVAFQGLFGAVLFKLFSFRVAAYIFPVIAMMESAWQKLLVATLIYGKALWQAIDMFFEGILKDFHLPKDLSFSTGIIILYSAVYAVWGIVLGIWITKLPRQIAEQAETMHHEQLLPQQATIQPGTRKPGTWRKALTTVVLLSFIIVVFLLGKQHLSKAAYVVARTIAIVALLMLVINPLFRWLMALWMRRTKSKKTASFEAITHVLPELRSYIQPAYQLSATQYKGMKRYRMFVLTLIALTLYPRNGND